MKNVKDLERDVWALSENIKNNLQGITNQAQALTDMRSDIDATEQSIADITSSLSSLDSSINTLEVGAISQAEVVSGHTNSITSLQTSVNKHSTAITTLESDVSDNATSISTTNSNLNTLSGTVSSQASTISSHSSAISTLQSNNTTLTNITTDHETRITTLENSSGSGSGGGTANILPSYYGTSVYEISSFETKVLQDEHFTHNGGSMKFHVGKKGTNGPKGTIFTRINPAIDTQFTGEIKIFLYNVPTGQTTTSLNLLINGESTALTPTINTIDNTITLPFDFQTGTVFNKFVIEFTDSNLVDTFAEFFEIICTNGANFACLNKDYRVLIFNTKELNGLEWNIVTQNLGHKHLYRNMPNQNAIELHGAREINSTTYDGITYYFNTIKATSTYYLYSTGNFVTMANNEFAIQSGENNVGFFWQLVYNVKMSLIENVYDISLQYNNEDYWRSFCGTKYDLTVFIGKDMQAMEQSPTINNIALPSEFILCTRFDDRLYKHFSQDLFLSGYLLLHKSGEVIYLPQKNSTYFIKLGKGLNPKGYVQSGRTQLTIYFQDFLNTKVFKKELNLNSITNKWELSPITKIYPETQEVFEYNENAAFLKQNNTFVYKEFRL